MNIRDLSACAAFGLGCAPKLPPPPVAPPVQAEAAAPADVFADCHLLDNGSINCAGTVLVVQGNVGHPGDLAAQEALGRASIEMITSQMGMILESSALVEDPRFDDTAVILDSSFVATNMGVVAYVGPEAGQDSLSLLLCFSTRKDQCLDLMGQTSLGRLPERLRLVSEAPTEPVMGDYRFPAHPDCTLSVSGKNLHYTCPVVTVVWQSYRFFDTSAPEQYASFYSIFEEKFEGLPGGAEVEISRDRCQFDGGAAFPCRTITLSEGGTTSRYRLALIKDGQGAHSLSCVYRAEGFDPCVALTVVESEPAADPP